MTVRAWVSLDLDDVLVDFLTPFLNHLNALAGTSFVRHDIVSTDWSECVDGGGNPGTNARALAALERMILSDDPLHLELRPGVASALVTLKNLGAGIVLNTRRRYRDLSGVLNRRFATQTHRWVQTHLPGIIDAVEIVDGAAGKAEVCARYPATVHCDDRVSNLLPICKMSGCHAILLSAPWNAGHHGTSSMLPARPGTLTRAASVDAMFHLVGWSIVDRRQRLRPTPRRPDQRDRRLIVGTTISRADSGDA